MHTMISGPHGPQRRDDGTLGQQITLGSLVVRKGDIVVPDYTNVSGLVDVTKCNGEADSPYSVWILASDAPAGSIRETTDYMLITEVQTPLPAGPAFHKGTKARAKLRGWGVARMGAAPAAAHSPLSLVVATGQPGTTAASGEYVICQSTGDLTDQGNGTYAIYFTGDNPKKF